MFQLSPEVEQAQKDGRPVVALETSVFAQGLPSPENRQVAEQMIEAVRQSGAVPAVLFLRNGSICAGASAEDLDQLCGPTKDRFKKVGAGDIGGSLMLGQHSAESGSGWGATTVSASLLIADHLKIRVFATGGIGGVHRGWSHIPDISADLAQLAKTQCTTVCSGMKNVLDVSATQEALEALSIPVLKYKTDAFPEFYTLGQATSAWTRCDTVAQVIRAVRNNQFLLQRGSLVCQPCPEEVAIDRHVVEHWIAEGLKSTPQGGKAVTPHLLSHLAQASQGLTLKANCALLVNNARLASSISTDLNYWRYQR